MILSTDLILLLRSFKTTIQDPNVKGDKRAIYKMKGTCQSGYAREGPSLRPGVCQLSSVLEKSTSQNTMVKKQGTMTYYSIDRAECTHVTSSLYCSTCSSPAF